MLPNTAGNRYIFRITQSGVELQELTDEQLAASERYQKLATSLHQGENRMSDQRIAETRAEMHRLEGVV